MSDTLNADTDREAWLAARRAGIGASEIAAVLGISPWESAFSLYWRKVNGWNYEASAEMEWGTRLEDAIAAKYQDAHPEREVVPAGLITHPLRPWHLATPDRLLLTVCSCPDVAVEWGADGYGTCRICDGWGTSRQPMAVLELKTAHSADGWGEPGTDEVPVYYRAQVLWQMSAAGVNAADIAVLIGGSDYREYTVNLDTRDLNMMIEAGRRFMERIANIDPPPLDDHHATLSTLRRLHPELADDDTPAEVEESIATGYLRAVRMVRLAEKAKQRYEIQLRAAMGDAHYASSGGRKVATRVISDVPAEKQPRGPHRKDYLLPPRSPKS